MSTAGVLVFGAWNLFQIPGIVDDWKTWRSWAMIGGVEGFVDIIGYVGLAVFGAWAAQGWWSTIQFKWSAKLYGQRLKDLADELSTATARIHAHQYIDSSAIPRNPWRNLSERATNEMHSRAVYVTWPFVLNNSA